MFIICIIKWIRKKYLNFFAFIFFRLRSHRASLTFSKAKMTKTKVILIEVTTWTQAVGRARNLKSKTIEIGCSNKKMFHSEGKSEKSYWAMKCNKYQLWCMCVYCYICQTNFLDFFCKCQLQTYLMFVERRFTQKI